MEKPPQLIDVGVNLTHSRFDPDRDEVIRRAQKVNVRAMVVTGTSVSESRDAQRLTQAWPNYLFSTAGCHPHEADAWSDDCAKAIDDLLGAPGVVAVGECGLDYFRNFSDKGNQRRAFEAQLRLAAHRQMPVFTHLRQAASDFLAMLADFAPDVPAVCVHCFTDGVDVLHGLLEHGCYVGVTGWLCDERRNSDLLEALPSIPQDRLLLETDAPFLLPRDLSDKPVNRRNEPAFLPHICDRAARVLQVDPHVLAEQTTANAIRFFRLPRPKQAPAGVQQP